MRMRNREMMILGRQIMVGLAVGLGLANASAQVAVNTYGYNNHRTGANLAEKTLTASNVSTGFGKLFTRNMGAMIRTAPLIAANVNVGGRTRNLMIGTNVKLRVVAFDADDRFAKDPIWSRTLASDWPATFPNTNLPTILSTPVIDPVTNTLFVVARSVTGDPNVKSNWAFSLYALDLSTGLDKQPPVVITGSVPGAPGKTEPFDAFQHQQRPALTLVDGKLYIAFCSIGDIQPYHGWVFVYDATTFAQLGILCVTPQGKQGGIWQAGQGLTVDDQGNVFTVTGNGSYSKSLKSFGNSVLKIDPKTLTFTDYFAPYNWAELNTYDLDLGSGGILHIPNSNVIITGSKQGKLYVLNTNALGGTRTDNDSNALQAIQACESHIHGTPVYYDGPSGPMLYVWSEEDYLKSFMVVGNRLVVPNVRRSSRPAPHGMPGGFMSISADGKKVGTGVLWVSLPWVGDANSGAAPGVLRAFDPQTLTELWNSEKLPIDDSQALAKYMPPTVANGKVYVSSYDGTVNVYGLLGKNLPDAPTVTEKIGPGWIGIYWPQVPDAKSYRVTRATDPDGPYTTIQNNSLTSCRDDSVVPGTTYYYRTFSQNATGQSDNFDQSAPLVAQPPATSDTYTWPVLANATIRDGTWANRTLGSSFIAVRKTADYEQQGLVKFDISGLPYTTSRVVLRLYGSNNEAATVPITAFTVANDSWVQGVVTWNTRPAPGTDIVTTNVSNRLQWYEWDLTSAVRAAQAAGRTTFSIGLRADSLAPAGLGLRTKENTSGNLPQLQAKAGPTTFNWSTFASASALTINGAANVNSGALQLTTNGPNQATSVFYGTPVNTGAFETSFSFRSEDALAEGLTFVISRYNSDIGYFGQELGFGPEPKVGKRLKAAAAIKFDFRNNTDEGANTTGLLINGRSPIRPGVGLAASGIDFSSGHTFRVRMTYDGTRLTVTTRDTMTSATATQGYDVNLFSGVGSGPAYVGFTASTGGLGGTIKVLDWLYRPGF